MNKPPKVVVIGAGSLFFGRKAIWSFCKQEGLKGGALALVDADPERLETMAAKRNAYYRPFDAQISAKYGIYLPSADTIGPGGIFRAMRELPVILETCQSVAELCPQAWVINYINPTSVNGIALMRRFPQLKSFALCDTHHMPGKHRQYLKLAGLDEADEPDFDLRIAGVNHFTWALKAERKGEDLLPGIRARMAELAKDEKDEGYSKARFNNHYGVQLYDIFGALPTCIGHTKEYVPYYQGRDHGPVKERRVVPFDSDEREARTEQYWEKNRAWASGEAPIDDFLENTGADHATDIVNAMVARAGQPYYLNVPNQGAVPNLPDDAFLELLCDVAPEGVKPRPVAPFPLGLRSLQLNVLDTHELTVEAIVKQDRALLRRAFLTDPLVESIPDTDAMIEELLEAERDAIQPHLPRFY